MRRRRELFAEAEWIFSRAGNLGPSLSPESGGEEGECEEPLPHSGHCARFGTAGDEAIEGNQEFACTEPCQDLELMVDVGRLQEARNSGARVVPLNLGEGLIDGGKCRLEIIGAAVDDIAIRLDRMIEPAGKNS